MRWIIFALLVLLCILTFICYALLVVASDADRRAERMYRKWREERDGNNNQML